MGGGKNAGSQAADAQVEGLDKAIDLQRELQAQNRLDLGQQRFYGGAALRQLAGGEMGLPDLGPLSYDPSTGATGLWSPGQPMASSPAPAGTLAQLGGGIQFGGNRGWVNLNNGMWRAPDGRNWNEDIANWMMQGGDEGLAPAAPAAAPTLAQLGNPGTPPYGQAGAGGLRSLYQQSPGFQYALNRSQQALERSAAARGRLGSGATLKALQENAIGLQNQDYGNFYNRLAGIAGMGSTATSNLANLNTQTGTEIGNLYQQQGNARAQGIVQDANARASGFNNLLSLGSFAISPFGPFSSVAAGGGRVGPLSGLFGG